MDKSLEALKRMKENSYYVDDKNLKEDFSILEQALLELKQIKEAEPSEAMESLERIDKEYATIENEDFKICFNTIKQTLLKAQEQEKILSIILKKRIDLESFYSTFIKDNLSYKYYEKYYGTYGLEKLTKEEYDILKEVLEE